MFKSRHYIVFLFALSFFSCTNRVSFHDYERWKISGWKKVSYMRSTPKEVSSTYLILLSDTSINATGVAVDTQLTRFDREGRMDYFRKSDGTDTEEDHYFFDDEGLIQQSLLTHKEGAHISIDTMKTVRKRLDERSFVIDYYQHDQDYQSDTVTFGVDDDVRLKRVRAGVPMYTLITWYKHDRPAKDEGSDGYGRTGHIYHYDKNDNLEGISFSNPDQKEVFINNEHGDPLLHYTTLGRDTTQLERHQYLYDSHGNWTRRLTWKKNLEPPVVFITNPRHAHYDLTIRVIRY